MNDAILRASFCELGQAAPTERGLASHSLVKTIQEGVLLRAEEWDLWSMTLSMLIFCGSDSTEDREANVNQD